MDENREINIDLRKVFTMLKKKIVFIVLITIIGGIIAGCITNFFIEPQYTATVKLHVYSSSDSRLGADSSITSAEYDASQKLVNTYLVVVESNTFLEKVADKLGNEASASAIKNMLSCSQIGETLAFQVSVTNTSPQAAMDIANIIADTCPDEIVRVLKVGGVEVIDYATEPKVPSSPNTRKNIMLGLGAAFAASFLFFFFKELFNTSINDEDDLKREFSNIPMLGTIPRLVPATESTSKSKDSDSKGNLEAPKPSINSEKNSEKEGK